MPKRFIWFLPVALGGIGVLTGLIAPRLGVTGYAFGVALGMLGVSAFCLWVGAVDTGWGRLSRVERPGPFWTIIMLVTAAAVALFVFGVRVLPASP